MCFNRSSVNAHPYIYKKSLLGSRGLRLCKLWIISRAFGKRKYIYEMCLRKVSKNSFWSTRVSVSACFSTSGLVTLSSCTLGKFPHAEQEGPWHPSALRQPAWLCALLHPPVKCAQVSHPYITKKTKSHHRNIRFYFPLKVRYFFFFFFFSQSTCLGFFRDYASCLFLILK